MSNNSSTKLNFKYWKSFLSIFIFFLSIFILIFSFIKIGNGKGYSLFIEFNDAYGLKEGTLVNFKGVKIGYVNRIKIHADKVIVLVKIQTLDIMLPKQCLIEANQIGLFNDRIINITPLKVNILYKPKKFLNLSQHFHNSCFISPNSYLKGYKGVNYDDLIRATTRISQRFDDPRFFNLFYILLQNSVGISEELFLLIYNSSSLFFYFSMLFM